VEHICAEAHTAFRKTTLVPKSSRLGGDSASGERWVDDEEEESPVVRWWETPMPGNAESNHLLGALPKEILERWKPHLESVDLKLGQVLYEAGGPLSHVYFPTSSIVVIVRPAPSLRQGWLLGNI
jgi:hypothetical protein